jgi:hypothetical protein
LAILVVEVVALGVQLPAREHTDLSRQRIPEALPIPPSMRISTGFSPKATKLFRHRRASVQSRSTRLVVRGVRH